MWSSQYSEDVKARQTFAVQLQACSLYTIVAGLHVDCRGCFCWPDLWCGQGCWRVTHYISLALFGCRFVLLNM
jgi:hypothetical protein